MFKIFLIIFLSTITFQVYSNENLLTIQQQIERLQREVSDLSQTVFSNQNNSSNKNNSDLVTNLSAIDLRIYDLEKDVKNLTANLEEIFFQIEDVVSKINNFEEIIVNLDNKLLDIKKNNLKLNKQSDEDENLLKNENTLGSLKITTDNLPIESSKENEDQEIKTDNPKLTPEEHFQSAFDNIRDKKWTEAKNSLEKFIENYPENQLSGSAHYWLGELYVLEKKYRDAALVFAEGFQKFPSSLKAPDMLYKLSQTLYKVDKKNESCRTLEKFILDFPKNKFIKNAKTQIQEYGCLEANE